MFSRVGGLAVGLVLLGAPLWAGREFTQGPTEQAVPNQIIVKFRAGAVPGPVISRFFQGAQIVPLNLRDHYLVRVPGGISGGITARLAAESAVDYLEPDRIRTVILAAPSDPYYVNSTTGQWGLFAIQANQAWSLLPSPAYLTAATAGTNRIKVAVLDTGADCGHPDFINAGGSSTNAALGGQISWTDSAAFVSTTVASPACAWQDDHGHGTHVSGILAAATSNTLGVAALGYRLQLIESKVLDSAGSAPDSLIASAITAAVNAGARVISLSLGGAGYSQTLQTAINDAWQRNVVVVAAAGNSSTNLLFFPAGAHHAVGVSATDINNAKAGFSNYGNGVTVAAPGVSILSTVPRYSVTLGCCNYGYLSGTSMATPFVSALAGLVAMTTPNTTAAAIIQRIQQSAANPSGNSWNPNFGFGIINAYNAVAGALRSTAAGGVSGQIVDPLGLPVAGAQLTLNGQTVATDGTGLLWMRPLNAGTYPVSVTAPGYTAQNLSVTVAPGADTPLSIAMGVSYGRFTGSVTDQGAPVAGAIVQALSSGLIVATTVADTAGQYTLWTPAGSGYVVQASQAGSANTSVSAQAVAAGGNVTVNLGMTALVGTVAGTVTNTASTPLAGAQVSIFSPVYLAGAVTASDGSYRLPRVPPGTYSIGVTVAGHTNQTQNGVTVGADSTTAVNFQLVPLPPAAPTFNPPAGTYGSAQGVTISSSPGASIRYTLDGSVPSSTTGALYTGPITVGMSVAVKAIAYIPAGPSSAVSTANYTITSSDWYSAAWSNRKAIRINRTRIVGGANLTSFPVLVSLTDGNLQTTAKSDGSDILFTASDGLTKLNHEVEQYAGGTLVTWVNVPAVSASADTSIYLYYGNPAAVNGQNPAGVWDSEFKGVYHLNGVTDSTGNGNHGVNSGTTTVTGKIGNGGGFGAGKKITAGSSGMSFGHGTGFTYEAWINPSNVTGRQPIWSRWRDGLRYTILELNGASVRLIVGDGSVYPTVTSSVTVGAGTWNHVAAVREVGMVRLYVNGALVGSATDTTAGDFFTSYGQPVMGYEPFGTPNYFSDRIDEVRVSGTSRSAGWIGTAYNNHSSPGTFYTVGAQETPGSGGSTAVTSAPEGLALTVDGTGCTTPCTFNWTSGTSHTLAAATQAGGAGRQYMFGSWSDGGAATHNVTAGAPATYTATFATQYYLTTAASPAASGTISPGSGWRNAGAVVSVSAAANAGYQFTGFSGGLTGTTTPQNVTMSGPVSVTAAFAAVNPGNWYGAAWSNRKEIRINRTRVVGGANLTSFPVLVSLTDGNLQATAKADGSDLLFTASDGLTKLNHEVEQYAGGTLVAWVNVPVVSATADTSIYLYYGNPAAVNGQNAAGVWDSEYKGVYHLNGVADSTGNGNHGVNVGTTAVAGKIGNGGGFGVGKKITAGSSGMSFGHGTGFTYEVWINPSNVTGRQPIWSRWRDGLRYTILELNGASARFIVGDGSAYPTVSSSVTVGVGTWTHVAAVREVGMVRLYVNGALVGSAADTTAGDFFTSYGQPVMGYEPFGTPNYFSDRIDEVRISGTSRSAGWIGTAYNNQSSPGTFYTLGAQETPGSGGSTVVTSAPVGLALTVDGTGCTTPCTFSWTSGTSHTLAAATQAGGAGRQYVFGSWSDGGAATHSVTAGAPATYTATFATQYYLTTAPSPAAGGTISPGSGWRNAGAVVSVSAAANAGYQFTGFSGGLTGTTPPQNVTMSGPVSVTANFGTQTVSGCPILPADNVWNTPINTLPVDLNSDAYIATIGASKGLHPDFSAGGGGIPYIVVPGTQPAVPIVFGAGAPESEPGPYPIPANAPIEGGADAHVIVVQTTSCKLYEMYASAPQLNGSWTASSGAVFDLTSNQLRPAGWTSADAAGLPIFAGLVRYAEVASGEIRHALRMTAPQTRNQYIWPARHKASNLSGPQYPPMGQRFRLKDAFDVMPYPADVQVILKALKKYGAILADNGSSWYLTGAPDSRWDDDSLHRLHEILGSNLEAVDESSLQIDPNSGAARQTAASSR